VRERKDIEDRLCNWAQWATAAGSRGADCMTGAICESMRRNALGDVWSGHEVSDLTDSKDAERIQLAMPKVCLQHRWLLNLYYVDGLKLASDIRKVARLCRFDWRKFHHVLREAQEAIEDAADNGNR
jgi:hypothetical protein